MINIFQGLSEIREALKRDPNNARALRAVAKHYLGEGQYKLAKNYFFQAVSLFPHFLPDILLDYEVEIGRDQAKVGPRLSLAGFELARGDLDMAVLELEEALETDPKSVDVYNVLGRIYIKLEKKDEAIALMEKSLREGVKDVALTEILAGVYLEKGMTKEAIGFYEEILNYKPTDKQTLRILGELYSRLEEYNQAARMYQAMFSDDPEVSREVIQRLEELLKKVEGSLLIREILAQIYLRVMQPEAAVVKMREVLRLDGNRRLEIIENLRGILKSYPGHPQASLALAEALALQGNYSEATETYYTLAKAKPECMEEAVAGYQQILELCPQQVLAHAYLAEAYLSKAQSEKALEEYEKMLRADPSSAEKVIKQCREILKTNPKLLLAHLVLGRAYLMKGDLQRGAMEAEGIADLDNKYTPAYLLLGEIYLKMNLIGKAEDALRMALAMDPYNGFIIEKYQEVRAREVDAGIEGLKARIAEDSLKVSLHLDLAKMYIQKNLKEEAIRELQVALKDRVRAPFAYSLLGCIYRAEGRYDLAASQYNRALEAAPAETSDFTREIRFNLGTTYEAVGTIRKALKIYEEILQEDIDFGDLKKRVRYLKNTSLQSLRDKALLAVITRYGQKEVLALWGREGKLGGGAKKEEMSISFGQEHNHAGFEYFIKGMTKAALEEFELAVQLDTKFAVGTNNLSIALLKEGRLAEARIKLEEALRSEPHSLVLRNNLGVVYYLTGETERGRKELESVQALDPELSALCLNLGDIYYAKGNIEPAIKLYQKIGKYDALGELAEQRLLYKTPDT